VSGGDYYSEFQDPSIKSSDAGVLKESNQQYNKYERKKRATKEVVYDNQIPSNRTLFMNCSLPNVQCLAVECYIGPLTTSQNTAIITFQMKADLKRIGKKNVKRIFLNYRSITMRLIIKILKLYFLNMKTIINNILNIHCSQNITKKPKIKYTKNNHMIYE
jgi:hypothetical protein